jgi:Glycosyl-4,4'-diaponeurosporenoate acyltransferase
MAQTLSRSAGNAPGILNALPIAAMSLLFLGPMLQFWLRVWGPLRPFGVPEVPPPAPGAILLCLAICFAVYWLPDAYYRTRAVESTGRLYEALGVRLFRQVVPNGDLINRARRRRDPGFRVVPNATAAAAYVPKTEQGERGHFVLLLFGAFTTAYAVSIGWHAWAFVLTAGNILMNLYPMLLQRYTRARLARIGARARPRR